MSTIFAVHSRMTPAVASYDEARAMQAPRAGRKGGNRCAGGTGTPRGYVPLFDDSARYRVPT